MSLIDLHQQQRLNQQGKDLGKVQRSAEQSSEMLEKLVQKVDTLTAICKATWELLQAETDLTEADLLEKMKAQLAQKAGASPQADVRVCAKCSRNNKAGRKTCMYCGAELPIGSAFELLNI